MDKRLSFADVRDKLAGVKTYKGKTLNEASKKAMKAMEHELGQLHVATVQDTKRKLRR